MYLKPEYNLLIYNNRNGENDDECLVTLVADAEQSASKIQLFLEKDFENLG